MIRRLVLVGLLPLLALARASEPAHPHADAALAANDAARAEAEKAFAKLPSDVTDEAWVKAKLQNMLEIDSRLRSQFNAPFAKRFSPEETRYYLKKFDKQLISLDKANTAALKELLRRHGWFKISKWGVKADEAAWLIAQHADTDLPFQKQVLGLLEKLYKSGETSPANYAFLADRVAVREGRPQRYGTQGGCVKPGHWAPDKLEPGDIDGRRRAAGLESLADEKDRNGDGCH
jgi:hypothetical protein